VSHDIEKTTARAVNDLKGCIELPKGVETSIDDVAERAVRIASSDAVNDTLRQAVAAARALDSPKKTLPEKTAAGEEPKKQVSKTAAEQDVAEARRDQKECLSTPSTNENFADVAAELFGEPLQLAENEPLLYVTQKSKTPKVSPLVNKGTLDAELAPIALKIYNEDKETFDLSKYTRAFFVRALKLQGPLISEFDIPPSAFDTQQVSKKAKALISRFSTKVVCTIKRRKEAREEKNKGKQTTKVA